jgi:hypothetical protein
MKFIEFGRVIPGLKIQGKDAPYPVLNERDGRAAAGIMFALASVAFAMAFLTKDFFMINIVVLLFLLEFSFRQINPYIAPFYILGKFIVSKQEPEWVGAPQKRFAWGMGLAMAATMVVLIYGFDVRGLVNLLFCITCLALMWFESTCGICIGCKMYYGLMSVGLIKKPKVMPACPGGVCSISKH